MGWGTPVRSHRSRPTNPAPNMKAIVTNSQRQAVDRARATQMLNRRVRINETPISTTGAVSTMSGPKGINAPVSSITYTIANASGNPLTYVIGDPNGLVAGTHGATWTQPTGVKFGAVAAIQAGYSVVPVAVKGINYIVSNAAQYDEPLLYRYGGQDGRYGGQPIDITPQLRNDQMISTRQTFKFDTPYLLDEEHCFTVNVPDGVQITLALILGANAA